MGARRARTAGGEETMKRRFAAAAFALAGIAAVDPAFAYIEAPYPLGRLITESSIILVIQVEKVDKEKNLILYRKVQDIKGKHPADVIRHNIGRGGFHPREWQNIMALAEPGKLAVMFHNGSACETCLDTYWYQCYAGGEWWNMSHAEPYLLRTFAGKPERLGQVVLDLLAGREVLVPSMVDGNKDDLHLRRGKIHRLRASLKIQDYNAQRDFVGWGNEDFRRILGMPGFTHVTSLARVDPEARGAAAAGGAGGLCLFGETKTVVLRSEGTTLNEVAVPFAGGARAAAWADYNGDGKPDLLLAAPSGARLLTNLGTAFRDDSAGLPREPYGNVTAAAWIDYDGDGRPDILVANGFLGLRLYRNLGPTKTTGPAKPQFGPWHYTGPFDNAGQKGFDTVYPPEREINLKAQYDVKGGQKAGWTKAEWADGQVQNLLPLFKPEWSTDSVIYLYREITVAAATDVPVSLGSDDTLTVWLNGKKLLAENVYRGAAPDQNEATLPLRPGKNDLLLKICQGSGDWAYYFATREPKVAVGPLFEDVSERAGLGPDGAAGRARGDHLASADVNGDGRTDFLYNSGEGVLVLHAPGGYVEARDCGIRYRAGRVAPAFGDFNGDGRPDLAVPQPGGIKLFRNDGQGKFTDVTAAAGDLAKPFGHATCAVWVDDPARRGRPDLLVGCLGGTNRFFRNLGGGRFDDASASLGLSQRVYNSRGVAALDLNKDGVWDLVLVNEGAEPVAFLGDPAWAGRK
jgi:hypothetical protein